MSERCNLSEPKLLNVSQRRQEQTLPTKNGILSGITWCTARDLIENTKIRKLRNSQSIKRYSKLTYVADFSCLPLVLCYCKLIFSEAKFDAQLSQSGRSLWTGSQQSISSTDDGGELLFDISSFFLLEKHDEQRSAVFEVKFKTVTVRTL